MLSCFFDYLMGNNKEYFYFLLKDGKVKDKDMEMIKK